MQPQSNVEKPVFSIHGFMYYLTAANQITIELHITQNIAS